MYVSVKRVFLDKRSYAASGAGEAPLYHQNNVVAYPQNPDAALRVLGMSPANLARTLQVQFVGEDRSRLRSHPDLQVSVDNLRHALHWLCENNWLFMEATKHHEIWETGQLDPNMEDLLDQYRKSVGTVIGGVPAEIIQGASRIPPERASVSAAGPADCVAPVVDKNESDPSMNVEATLGDQCAGIIDGGVDDLSPVPIYDQCMKQYKILQKATEELERLRNSDKTDEKAALRQRQALACAAAVEELTKLNSREVQRKLQEFVKTQQVHNNTLVVKHSDALLNNRDPLFWCSCFVRLFPRGDCAEKCVERRSILPAWRWAKTLLTRADSPLWRQDVEFVASVYNVDLRRDQVHAVEAGVRAHSFSASDKAEMEKLTAAGLVSLALASGDVESVRAALRKKNLEKPIETAFRKMQIIQRNVRGSEAEKDNLMPKLFALRLWSGC